jgi:hypothetical protein
LEIWYSDIASGLEDKEERVKKSGLPLKTTKFVNQSFLRAVDPFDGAKPLL